MPNHVQANAEPLIDAVLLQGLPGSGKSTAAESYIQHTDSVDYVATTHYSVGNHLRGILAGTIWSEFTEQIRDGSSSLSRSERLDDKVVNAVVYEYLQSVPSKNLILLDGYPLYVEQIECFATNAEKSGLKILGVLDFVVSPTLAVDRILGRGTRKNEDAASIDFATRRVNEHIRDCTATTAALAEVYPYIKIDGSRSEIDILGQITATIERLRHS